ncbi:MAG: hypothetical protein GWN62_31315, partial [Aliifodinibius sp.]|nr:hypothetical protein [Nitrosopumilaceae archaeon]NIV15588.1 hypothetical protein [Fodinibius sp.]NIX62663.1 hypothetical protein [Nitrosopumilaceae archaeon]
MMQGMMQGGMMSQQGMRAMCSKMMKGGMMDGKGMMHGKGMQGGMMGHMMNMMHGQGMMGHHSPMGTYMHLINHVPNMKTSLELSDDQINNLKSIQSNFFKR